MMAHWASFARHGDPNPAARAGSVPWPMLKVDNGTVEIHTMRFSVEATDGVPTGLVDGIRDRNCDFWDALYQ